MLNFTSIALAFAVVFATNVSASESKPFKIIVSSKGPLNGFHAYINNEPPFEYQSVMQFTSDSTMNPANFTIDSDSHLLAHLSSTITPTLLEANTNNDAYDENIFFSTPEFVATGQNPPTWHKYSTYLSGAVTSEGMTRLSKLYVCPKGVGYGTVGGALKIGNVVLEGCESVRLDFVECVGTC